MIFIYLKYININFINIIQKNIILVFWISKITLIGNKSDCYLDAISFRGSRVTREQSQLEFSWKVMLENSYRRSSVVQ